MSTSTLTPAGIGTQPPPHNRRVSRLFTIAGGIAIVALIFGAVSTGFRAQGAGESRLTANADGITALDLDVSGVEMDVVFAETNEATIDIETTGWFDTNRWSFERRGNDTLRVSISRGFSFWPQWGSDRVLATLTLPAELEGQIDSKLDLSAGSLEMIGDVRDLEISVAAGSVTFDGASTALNVDVAAGEAFVTTSDPQSVAIDISAGRSITTISGRAPSSTSVSVSAGDAILKVPDEEYNVTGSAAAGTRTIDVRTNSASRFAMDVEVSAGSAVVRYVD
ncbi:MAG: DUF4097 domain-containing protein [Rhodococcus sp. (in: high G+C Gram-positive bacteria)]|nr:DUF4097 domain-containing protein [Rhodococcus sp. (in: high G+C Gram-positive bacteria)]